MAFTTIFTHFPRKPSLFVALLVLVSSCYTLGAQAQVSSIRLEADELNQALAKNFPIERKFNDVNATFSKPKTVIDSLDKTLKVDVRAVLKRADQILSAVVRLEGTIKYDATFEVIEILEPKLDEVMSVEGSTLSDDNRQHLIKVLKQSLLGDLPDLTLFELSSLDLEYRRSEPASIDVELNGLSIEFKK